MSLKKYAISVLICAVTIFVILSELFMPVLAYADEWAVDWFGSNLWRNQENKLQDEDVYYFQYFNSDWFLLGFSIAPSSVVKTSVNSNWDKVTLTFDVQKSGYQKSGYFINNYKFSYGEIVYTGRSSTNKTTYEVTCLKDTSYSNDKIIQDDTSFFGRLSKGLKDMWYSDTISTGNFLFGDDTFKDYWNNIGTEWTNFVKTVLDINDNDTLNTALTDIYNNDFSKEYWSNVDTNKISQLQNTSNNLKQFWYNNVSVICDGDGDVYHYEIKNFNPTTKSYPSYLYDMNYFYNNILYPNSTEIDLTSLYEYLNKISFKLDTIISNTNILTNILTNIDTNFTALGGVIAGAIGVAWADIKADLQLIIDGINFNFKLGDIIIGDSTSSDDDTSNNINVRGLDHIFDDLKVNLDSLLDKLTIKLDDLFSDIHITIDNSSGDNPDNPGDVDNDDDDFWKQVRDIVIRKIPLYSQLLELVEPTTNINYQALTNNTLLEDSSSESSGLSLLSTDTTILDGLVCISNSNNSIFLRIIFDDVEFYGYQFSSFDIDISYYYTNYRIKVSNVILSICYLSFAWHVIHNVSKIIGRSGYSGRF